MTPIEAAHAILDSCRQADVKVHLLGGVGVYLVSPSAQEPPFLREYNDIDVVISRKQTRQFTQAAQSSGFEPDKRFNSFQGDKRMLFYMDAMPMDVFVGVFEQCHTLDLEPRFPRELPSLRIEDLLLTKLQVRELTAKDLNDSLVLLLDHEFGESENELSLKRLTDVLSGDWGWFTTVMDNLGSLAAWLESSYQGQNAKELADKIRVIREHADGAPKSLRWKARSRVGRRLPWYQMPEDKAR